MTVSPTPCFAPISQWLTGDGVNQRDDAGLVAGLGRRLQLGGIAIDRMSLHIGTLHPDILGRTITWAPNRPVEIHDREHGIEPSTRFVGSALHQVMTMGEPRRVRPTERAQEELILPLGEGFGAVAFETTRLSGFSPAETEVLERLGPVLSAVLEQRSGIADHPALKA